MSMMNANALFVGANVSNSYHQAILLPDPIKRTLREADHEIRITIRAAAEKIVRIGDAMSLATDRYRALQQAAPDIEFRFLLQGGTAYKTDIMPAFTPPQQSDRDVGVYVKTSFVSRDDPGLASKKLFELVEKSLKILCEKKGWKLKRKATCVRVELNETLHIDLPLYAIPDDEFETLKKALMASRDLAFNDASDQMLSIFAQDRNLRIPADRVMLAHRTEGWIHSDPRALHDWFEEQFRRYGPQLRRQARYLKGWRDFSFQKAGPSSVALMVCAANCYRAGDVRADEDRDDLAFLQITKKLPTMLKNNIFNPVLDAPTALNDWDDIERQKYIGSANDLQGKIDSALNGHYVQDLTVRRLQDALGGRVPNRPDLVKAFSKVPEISRPAKVAAVSPLPAIGRTTSG